VAAEQFATTLMAGVSTHGGSAPQRALPYSLVVHAYSNLSLQAYLWQKSFEPGTTIDLHASLAQSGIPLAHHAHVWADVRRPYAATTTTVAMSEGDDGQFAAQFATTEPGVYRARIRASGTTMTGEAFTREKTLTASAWRGGDRAGDPGNSGQVIVDYLRDRDARLCELVKCFLQEGGLMSAELEKQLKGHGVDIARARRCVAEFCRGERHRE
jgi:hypothetical protein